MKPKLVAKPKESPKKQQKNKADENSELAIIGDNTNQLVEDELAPMCMRDPTIFSIPIPKKKIDQISTPLKK
jgi:hypothetical protein